MRYVSLFGFSAGLAANALLNVGLCIAITHTYHLFIQRLAWLDLPLQSLIPRIIAAVTLMSTILGLINIPIDYYTIPAMRQIWTNLSAIAVIFIITSWGQHFLLWALIYHVYQYADRSRRSEVEKMKLLAAVKEFESKLLRAQLNPHFMFNAMNSIRALIMENPEKSQTSITKLSNLLRSSLLADRRKTVSLEEELKTVQDYLALEKIRFEDRLQVTMQIDAKSLSVQVPPLMIQTLAENAVKHGVSTSIKGGTISIVAKNVNAFTHIAIYNTGMLQTSDTEGFGLANTKQRLALLFGKQASFEIRQEPNEIVCAEVILPTVF
jgi:two-component system, LytTR family, sensor kinase